MTGEPDMFRNAGDVAASRACAVDGCGRKSRKLGMCDMHYWRVRRHGDAGEAESTRAAVGEPLAWLLAHVDYDGPECLLWPFARDDQGRGTMRPSGLPTEYAHRRMCVEVNGPPPGPDMDAAHNCGRGHAGCVHPKHLRWDTRAGNIADRVLHGTDQLGSKNHRSKLDETKVRQIRAEHDHGISQASLARKFRVAPNTINAVVTRQTWRHL